MNDDDIRQPPGPGRAPAPRPSGKLPYERPAVISEDVFETLALSCVRTGFSCPPAGNRS
jgi:hypothetical protein